MQVSINERDEIGRADDFIVKCGAIQCDIFKSAQTREFQRAKGQNSKMVAKTHPTFLLNLIRERFGIQKAKDKNVVAPILVESVLAMNETVIVDLVDIATVKVFNISTSSNLSVAEI